MRIRSFVSGAAVVFAAMVWVVGADPVHAAPPAKATDITGPKLVFVTAGVFNGALGGLEGADAKCQFAADTAGLDGNFQAWLADGTGTPTTRFTTLSLGPYFMLDGRIVDENFAALLDGSILQPIDIDEAGVQRSSLFVWTNVDERGAVNTGGDCDGWLVGGGGSRE